jgi:hypothetical protein
VEILCFLSAKKLQNEKMMRIFSKKGIKKGMARDEKRIKLSLGDKTIPGFSIPIPLLSL